MSFARSLLYLIILNLFACTSFLSKKCSNNNVRSSKFQIYINNQFPHREKIALRKALVYLNSKVNYCLSFEIIEKQFDYNHISTKDNEIYIIRSGIKFPAYLAEYQWEKSKRIIYYYNQSFPISNTTITNIYLHEFGHALGLFHVIYRASFMQPTFPVFDQHISIIDEESIEKLCLYHCCK